MLRWTEEQQREYEQRMGRSAGANQHRKMTLSLSPPPTSH